MTYLCHLVAIECRFLTSEVWKALSCHWKIIEACSLTYLSSRLSIIFLLYACDSITIAPWALCCSYAFCIALPEDWCVLSQFSEQNWMLFWCRSTVNSLGPSAQRINSVTEAVSTLDLNEDSEDKTWSSSLQPPVSTVPECKCGMPLCICVVSLPPAQATPVQVD